MLPIITRSTEEVLKLLPNSIREAGLALGLPKWRVILFILVRACKAPIATGVVLALARITGESAPLLFTAFGNEDWSKNLLEPIATLPVQIYFFAMSPYPDQNTKAWTGAFVLIILVFLVNLLIRLISTKRKIL
jgi:phosphate transport system permease protein